MISKDNAILIPFTECPIKNRTNLTLIADVLLSPTAPDNLHLLQPVYHISNQDLRAHKSIVYQLWVDNSYILKIGGSCAESIKSCIQFYLQMTKSMNRGRYMPYYAMATLLTAGHTIQIQAEILEDSFRKVIDLESPSNTVLQLVSGYKNREADWISVYKDNLPYLNRQESGAGDDTRKKSSKVKTEDLFTKYCKEQYVQDGCKIR